MNISYRMFLRASAILTRLPRKLLLCSTFLLRHVILCEISPDLFPDVASPPLVNAVPFIPLLLHPFHHTVIFFFLIIFFF